MHLFHSYPTNEIPDIHTVTDERQFAVSGTQDGSPTNQFTLGDNQCISFITPVKINDETGGIEPSRKSKDGTPISQTVLIERDKNRVRLISLV